MTIRTESGEGSFKRDRAAEADAGFLVAAFRANPDEVLEEGIFGGVGGENEDVVVAFAELGGDLEFPLGDVGVAQELREFLLTDDGKSAAGGIEFGEKLAKCVVVIDGEFGEFVVSYEIADLFGAARVMLILDGNFEARALGGLVSAVAFRNAAGEF